MKAAEIQVIPIGGGVSVRKEVSPRDYQGVRAEGSLHAYGTNVEGDLDTVLATIKKLHETLLNPALVHGAIGATDKHARLEDKLFTA